MPSARGVKRPSQTISNASLAPKTKKKRTVFQLEIPTAPNKRGRLLTCGQGDVGQLGLGEDVPETSKFKYVSALGDNIVDACAGGMHTVALDSDGKVWTFGCNDEGALGRRTADDTEEGTPGRVALPRAAVAVSAGDSHTAALLDNGDVYAWGAFRDSHGSMGLIVQARTGKSCKEPVSLELGEQAVSIASGGDHLVVLTTSGSVYTLGCGEQGQLGRLCQRSASRDSRQGLGALLTPGKVMLKGGVSKIWAGYHATIALHTSTKIYAWGLNNYAQLGITDEKRKTAVYAPIECDAFGFREWEDFACGQHHSIALDAEKKVFAVGRHEYGRLGLGTGADAETPELVPKLQSKRCISIAAGTSNSYAVTDSGEVFAWGMGSEGQLGTGACADATEPASVALVASDALSPRRVCAGGQHALLLVVDPNKPESASPIPEPSTSQSKVGKTKTEPKEAKGRQTKRQQKASETAEEAAEDDASSAKSMEVAEETNPEKVNGKDKKETPMEVDETDNTTKQDKEEEQEPEKPEPEKTEPEKTEPEKLEPEKPEPEKPEPEAKSEEPKPEIKPEEPTRAEPKPEETIEPEPAPKAVEPMEPETTEAKANDVEMKEVTENGIPEAEKKTEQPAVSTDSKIPSEEAAIATATAISTA